MKKPAAALLALLTLLLSLMLPWSVRAQAAPSLTTLTIDLWPEFDRPNMLVMYNFSLSAEAQMPAQIELRIPKDAQPNAVAVCQPGGSCFDTPFTQNNSGAWRVLTIQATLPDVRVEYYDPGLVKNGSQRTYTFNWPGDYAVGALRVSVQQPPEAREMRLEPGSFVPSQGQDGMNYYVLDYGALGKDQPFKIGMSYTKESDTLTSNNAALEAAQPLTGSDTGRSGLPAALPVVLGLVGVALIVGGGVWYWRSGSRQRVAIPRRRSRGPAGEEPSAAGPVYCHQCGKRASDSDRFCRSCGVELRR